MSILNKLASSLGRRDEEPNVELAKQIAAKKDKNAVKELVDNLSVKSVQNDCIKALYELGVIEPSLIAPYYKEFIALLTSKNNRLQWGSMTALSEITLEEPAKIYASLSAIMDAAEKGSVITKDQFVNVLVKLGSIKKYTDDVFLLLNEQILNSAINQLPMYAEKAMSVVSDSNKATFIRTLNLRLKDLEQESKRKRLEKVLKKMGK